MTDRAIALTIWETADRKLRQLTQLQLELGSNPVLAKEIAAVKTTLWVAEQKLAAK